MAHFTRKRRKKSFTLGTPKDIAVLLWVAEQKGFLADHDVTVDFVYVPYARKAFEMLLNGELDTTAAVETNAAYLGYAEAKIPVKCLFSMEKRTADNILIRKNDAEPKDLIGKTIGFMPRTTSHTFLMQFLKKHEISKQNIKLKPMTPQAMPNAFMRDEVDAISLWQPHTNNTILSLKELDIPYTHFKNFGFYQSEVAFAANKTFIIRHRPMIQNLIKALKDAENLLKSDKELSYKILAERMKISGPDYKEVLDQYQPAVSALGEDYIRNLEFLGEWIRENDTEHMGKPMPSYCDYIDNNIFLETVTEKE